MILACDVGNTNIVFGVFEEENLIMESRVNTDGKRMADQYAILLSEILSFNNVPKEKITGAIISSVVPPVTAQLKTAVTKMFGSAPMVVGPGLKTGLNIKIDDPGELGGDLVCGAVAAKNKYPLPSIIIDLGTATKVMALDKDGALLGGVIAPGVSISMEALSSKTAALPLISAETVEKVICKNTVDCMRSGVVVGTACMLDGLINRFEEELCDKCFIVATGGFCTAIAPYCEHKFVIDEHLILFGLKVIFDKNNF